MKDENEEENGEEEKKELFVSNLPFSMDQDNIHSHFEKYGEISNIKVLTRPDGKPKGIAFILFENHKDAKKALAENGTVVDGRDLKVSFSGGKPAGGDQGGFNRGGPRNGGGSSGASGTTLFCGNLSFKSSEQSLRRHFQSCGEVLEVRIAKDEEGKSRGFAHIEFASPDDAQKALSLNG